MKYLQKQYITFIIIIIIITTLLFLPHNVFELAELQYTA